MASELTIEGGTVVSPAGSRRADVQIRDGRIVALTEVRAEAAERTVDADGLLVLPGFIDAHVHLMDPGDPEREDWEHGSAAAAASGVTTVLEHTHVAPVLDREGLIAKRDHAGARSRVDFGLAAHLFPESIDEIPDLWREGAAFFKAFTCTTHGVPGLGEDELLRSLRSAAAVGAPVLAHCEDEAIVDAAEESLRADGRADNGLLTEWRSRAAERVATERVLRLAQVAGARVVIAHASHPEILALIVAARDAGTQALGETCPQYLTLLEEEVRRHGALRKFTPPARARSDDELARMWAAARTGAGVDYISSDHAPSTRDQKEAGDIWTAHFGLPGLDTTSAILIDAAVGEKISFERLVELYAVRPAGIYGLPRKGVLAPGFDADLVLVDPAATRKIETATIRSKAGWSPYEGRALRGTIAATYLRGQEIYAGGRVVGQPGGGRPVSGAGAVV